MASFFRELPGTPLVVVEAGAASAAEDAILDADERARAAAFAIPKRRDEWVLGRLAAKAALARALDETDPRVFRIGASPDGAPAPFRSSARGVEPLAVGLSVTHGHGRAAAWALPEGLPGVDLERVKPRPEGTFRFYLDERERAPLLALAGEARDRAAVVFWSLKEAAWKTLRPGRGVGLIDFELGGVDPGSSAGKTVLVPRGPAVALARERGVTSVAAEFRVEGDLVYAWARAD